MAKRGLREGVGMDLQPQTMPVAAHSVTECGDHLELITVTSVSKVTHFPGFLLKQIGGSPKPIFDACAIADREQMRHADPRNLVGETFSKSFDKQLEEKPSVAGENTVSCFLTADNGLTDCAMNRDQGDGAKEVSAVEELLVTTTAEANTEHYCASVLKTKQLSEDKMTSMFSSSGLNEASENQPSQSAVHAKSKKTVLPASLLAQVTSVVKQVFGFVPPTPPGYTHQGTSLTSLENPGVLSAIPESSVDNPYLERGTSHSGESCSTSSFLELTSLTTLDQNISQESCLQYTNHLEIVDNWDQVNKQTGVSDACGDKSNSGSDTIATLPNISCITNKSTETFKELPELDAPHGATNTVDSSSLRKRNMDSISSIEDVSKKEGEKKKRKKMQHEKHRMSSCQAVSEVLQMLRAESCGKDDDGNQLANSQNKDGAVTKQTSSKVLDSNRGAVTPAGGDNQSDGTSDKKKKNGAKKKQAKLSKATGSTGTKMAPDNESKEKTLWDELPQYIPESDSRMVNKKKKNKNKVYDLSALFSGTLGQAKKPRPNYFLAVQITNPEIIDGLSKVLAAVEEADKKVKPAFINVAKLHITLTVMHLPDEDAINRAKTALDDFKQKMNEETMKEEVKILTFDVSGLGNFRHQVVFAKVAEGPSLDRLCKIAALVRASMVDKDIKVLSDFNPHITIMKMSKGVQQLKRQGVKKIEEQLYKDFSDKHFGAQVALNVQLCAMHKSKVDDYYHIEHEVSL